MTHCEVIHTLPHKYAHFVAASLMAERPQQFQELPKIYNVPHCSNAYLMINYQYCRIKYCFQNS